MAILKLPNEGDVHIGTVTACREVKGKYGVQVQFTFDNGDDLYIGADTAARQLIRAGFDDGNTPPRANYEAVEGNVLRFSRDHNANAPDKPYWGITLADAVDKASAKAPPPKRMTQEQAVKALDLEPHPKTATTSTAAKSWDVLRGQYTTCFAAALDILGQKATAEAAQAMAFSLYKAARDEHITVPVKVTPIAAQPVKVNPKPAPLPDPSSDEDMDGDGLPF